jgi:hypothetical protein
MPHTYALRWPTLVFSFALYVASLPLPALQLRYHHDEIVAPTTPAIDVSPSYPPVLTPQPPPPPPPPPPDRIISHPGWKLAIVSIAGPLDGNFAILANPLLWCGWALLVARRFRATAFVCAAAVLLALQTFQLRLSGMYEDESGSNIAYLTHPLVGWYLWLAAMLLPLAAAMYFCRKSAALAASEVPAASR